MTRENMRVDVFLTQGRMSMPYNTFIIAYAALAVNVKAVQFLKNCEGTFVENP